MPVAASSTGHLQLKSVGFLCVAISPRTKRKRKHVNEETIPIQKTETLEGSGGIQRQTRSEKSLLDDIQIFAKEEADLYAKRGYGGYINTQDLQRLRSEYTDAALQLPPTHPTRIAWEKTCSRRN